jgi:uncharacterized membrane protein YuzA (DUF378 family)
MGDMIFFAAVILSAIGAINWGLETFMNVNLVERCCKPLGVKGLDKVLYGIIALSGVYMLYAAFTFIR